MPVWLKRLGWVVLGVCVVLATTIALFVIVTLRLNETNGLTLIDSWQFSYPTSPNDPPDRWQQLVANTPAEESKRNPNLEMIRFVYEPSFHPHVCIAVWKDGDECWIRSTVGKPDRKHEGLLLWQKTKPLSVAEWNRLRTLLQQKSVADPLNGVTPAPGFDGSRWFLQSSIGGQTTSAQVDNPVVTKGLPNFETITPLSPIMADFVDTCRLLLKLGEVRVPEML